MTTSISVRPDTVLIDPKTGAFTREGFLIIQALTRQVNDATSDYILVDATQTLTNKTLTAPVINGGTITGIADLAVADGGTGASNAAGARTNLGLVIGTDVQANDADLTSWAGVARAGGFDTFATTPSSANLASLVTGETGSGALVFGTAPTLDLPKLTSYTVVGLPAAATAGRLAYVSNETGGATIAFDDGANWRRVQDRAVVS